MQKYGSTYQYESDAKNKAEYWKSKCESERHGGFKLWVKESACEKQVQKGTTTSPGKEWSVLGSAHELKSNAVSAGEAWKKTCLTKRAEESSKYVAWMAKLDGTCQQKIKTANLSSPGAGFTKAPGGPFGSHEEAQMAADRWIAKNCTGGGGGGSGTPEPNDPPGDAGGGGGGGMGGLIIPAVGLLVVALLVL
jgi:hypothetical protein